MASGGGDIHLNIRTGELVYRWQNLYSCEQSELTSKVELFGEALDAIEKLFKNTVSEHEKYQRLLEGLRKIAARNHSLFDYVHQKLETIGQDQATEGKQVWHPSLLFKHVGRILDSDVAMGATGLGSVVNRPEQINEDHKEMMAACLELWLLSEIKQCEAKNVKSWLRPHAVEMFKRYIGHAYSDDGTQSIRPASSFRFLCEEDCVDIVEELMSHNPMSLDEHARQIDGVLASESGHLMSNKMFEVVSRKYRYYYIIPAGTLYESNFYPELDPKQVGYDKEIPIDQQQDIQEKLTAAGFIRILTEGGGKGDPGYNPKTWTFPDLFDKLDKRFYDIREKHQLIFVSIFTHGVVVHLHDTSHYFVDYETLLKQLNKTKELRNTPKILFLQACASCPGNGCTRYIPDKKGEISADRLRVMRDEHTIDYNNDYIQRLVDDHTENMMLITACSSFQNVNVSIRMGELVYRWQELYSCEQSELTSNVELFGEALDAIEKLFKNTVSQHAKYQQLLEGLRKIAAGNHSLFDYVHQKLETIGQNQETEGKQVWHPNSLYQHVRSILDSDVAKGATGLDSVVDKPKHIDENRKEMIAACLELWLLSEIKRCEAGNVKSWLRPYAVEMLKRYIGHAYSDDGTQSIRPASSFSFLYEEDCVDIVEELMSHKPMSLDKHAIDIERAVAIESGKYGPSRRMFEVVSQKCRYYYIIPAGSLYGSNFYPNLDPNRVGRDKEIPIYEQKGIQKELTAAGFIPILTEGDGKGDLDYNPKTWTFPDLFKKLDNRFKDIREKHHMIFVSIFTHGIIGHIHDTFHQYVDYETLFKQLNKTEELRNTPKILFLQACASCPEGDGCVRYKPDVSGRINVELESIPVESVISIDNEHIEKLVDRHTENMMLITACSSFETVEFAGGIPSLLLKFVRMLGKHPGVGRTTSDLADEVFGDHISPVSDNKETPQRFEKGKKSMIPKPTQKAGPAGDGDSDGGE